MEDKESKSQNKKDWSIHEFKTPKKEITSPEDLEKFKKSKLYQKLMEYICELQRSVTSKKISATKKNSKFDHIVEMVENFEKLVEEVPPIQQPMRFGNKAFKTLHEKYQQSVDDHLKKILPENLQNASSEIKTYILDSFGSPDRLDFGTGHELSFTIFLYCLKEIGLYDKEDYEGVVRNVFYAYIKLMRKIQLTYMLEPAGSHGVWGLDDYHFLPFLLGAAELINSDEVPTPDCIHKDDMLRDYSDEFMYLSCIKFIKTVKNKVSFQESSPMLNDISAAVSWQKVSIGMVKMYQAEVLHKLPVAKHIYFGSIFTLNE